MKSMLQDYKGSYRVQEYNISQNFIKRMTLTYLKISEKIKNAKTDKFQNATKFKFDFIIMNYF